jgi:two-component system response regulator
VTAVRTILVVDDDEAHRFIARRAILAAGLTADVRTAADGDEALCMLGLAGDGLKSGLEFAVVLLDVRMPGLSGWEVLRRMRASEHTRGIPVVMVSSSNQRDDVKRSVELGANSYVIKRSDPERPGAYLADAARYWTELNLSV